MISLKNWWSDEQKRDEMNVRMYPEALSCIGGRLSLKTD